MIPSAYFPGVWTINMEGNQFIPPVETFYILAENGDFITDESGNRLIQEIAP